ncbi:MAG TPA: hypothetical protein VGC95_06145 [Chitinophagaceae bacterium]|jgi:hypothetical protein
MKPHQLRVAQAGHRFSAADFFTRSGKWVILGYVLCLVGGIPGIIVGCILLNSFAPQNDDRASAFARKHGRIIINFGCLMLVAAILFFMNWFFLEKILFGDADKYKTLRHV